MSLSPTPSLRSFWEGSANPSHLLTSDQAELVDQKRLRDVLRDSRKELVVARRLDYAESVKSLPVVDEQSVEPCPEPTPPEPPAPPAPPEPVPEEPPEPPPPTNTMTSDQVEQLLEDALSAQSRRMNEQDERRRLEVDQLKEDAAEKQRLMDEELQFYRKKSITDQKTTMNQANMCLILLATSLEFICDNFLHNTLDMSDLSKNISSALERGEFDPFIKAISRQAAIADVLSNPMTSFVFVFGGVIATTHLTNKGKKKRSPPPPPPRVHTPERQRTDPTAAGQNHWQPMPPWSGDADPRPKSPLLEEIYPPKH